MKALYILAPLSLAALAGCAYETVYTPTPTAYVTPTYVTPTYVAPANTVIVGSGSSWSLMDSDGDGYANGIDRFPYDARFH